MYTEYLIINHDTQCQKVEHVGEVMPDIGITVFARALGVETVRLGDAARLVVAADKVYSLGISQLETHQK